MLLFCLLCSPPGNYICERGILNEGIRDEILCQIVNQTWLNPNDLNAERAWMLLAACLSAFPPSDGLYPYLLCYVSVHGMEEYKAFTQHKLLRGAGRQARRFSPCMLEWESITHASTMALQFEMADRTQGVVKVGAAGECVSTRVCQSMRILRGAFCARGR